MLPHTPLEHVQRYKLAQALPGQPMFQIESHCSAAEILLPLVALISCSAVKIPMAVANIIVGYALCVPEVVSNPYGSATAVISHLGILVCRGARYAALSHAIEGVRSVVASLYEFAVCTYDGKVYVWGTDSRTQKVYNVAGLIPGKYTQIAATNNNIYALDTRGDVWEISLRFFTRTCRRYVNVAKMVVAGSHVFFCSNSDTIWSSDKEYPAHYFKRLLSTRYYTRTDMITHNPDKGLVNARDIKSGTVMRTLQIDPNVPHNLQCSSTMCVIMSDTKEAYQLPARRCAQIPIPDCSDAKTIGCTRYGVVLETSTGVTYIEPVRTTHITGATIVKCCDGGLILQLASGRVIVVGTFIPSEAQVMENWADCI